MRGTAGIAALALIAAMAMVTAAATPASSSRGTDKAMVGDYIQTRVYTGDKYVSVVVPEVGDRPIVLYNCQPTGDRVRLTEYSRYGAYVVSIEWGPDEECPTVQVIEDDPGDGWER